MSRPNALLIAAALIAVVLAQRVHAEADVIGFDAVGFDAVGFDARVARAMAAWRIPGMVVAVFEEGRAVHVSALGTADLERGTPVTRGTFFVNASTTKAMVVAGVLMLVDEARLDLDDPVIRHIPELHFADPALTPQITIRDLLTHRTGLPSTDFWTFNQGMPLAEQLPRLQAVTPIAAPRARKIYQNTMYELAGLVIERVTGQRWDAFLTERLWSPIGMGTRGSRDALPAEHAQVGTYELFDNEITAVAHSLRPHVADAAGSAMSSIDDMVLWLEFLLRGGITETGERLLSESALAEMFTPQQLVAERDYYPTAALTHPNWVSYGLGWYQQDFQGRKIDYHTGSLNGAVALAGLDRASGRGVVIMANLGGAELRHGVLWDVMDTRPQAARNDWLEDVRSLYAARSEARAAQRAAARAGRLEVPASLPLAAYAGGFDSHEGGHLEVRVEGEGLRLETDVRHYRLTHWHADIFELMHADWANSTFARFNLTPSGEIEALEAFGMRFDRVEMNPND